MTEPKLDLRSVVWRDVFPWLHLFRSFQLARDVKKIAFGALGAVLTTLGWRTIIWVLLRDDAEGLTRDWRTTAQAWPWSVEAAGKFTAPVTVEGWSLDASSLISAVILPIRTIVFPGHVALTPQGSLPVGILMLLWTVLVWAICGGAISRIAAVQIGQEGGHVSAPDAAKFVFSRLGSYLLPPLLPLAGVGVVMLFCLLGGLLLRVPGVNVVLATLWFLPLAAGLVMAIALFVLALGWPLMFPAIGAEASEGFDSLSRSYSYVLGRPLSYLFYAITAIAYGAVVTAATLTVAYWAVRLCHYGIGLGGGETASRGLFAFAPDVGGWRTDFGPLTPESAPTGMERLTALVTGFWLHFAWLGVIGFLYSYFWSASTVIYFLLRHEVDETAIEEVYFEEAEEEPFPTILPNLVTPKPAGESKPGDDNPLKIIDPRG